MMKLDWIPILRSASCRQAYRCSFQNQNLARYLLMILKISGFLVSLFSDFWEFPFSHHFFFRYVGLFVAFAYHGFLCTSVKLYIMCAMLLLAVFPYVWLEMKLDTRSRRLVPTWHHWAKTDEEKHRKTSISWVHFYIKYQPTYFRLYSF